MGKVINLNITEDMITTSDFDNTKFRKHRLVMHVAETDVMKEFAKVVTQNGGDILEIGFGMGISATEIQTYNIKSHTIIEKHPEIYKKACEWAKDKPNVTILHGDWFDMINTLNRKFDGIFHDTHRDVNKEVFPKLSTKLANEDCIMTMFNYGTKIKFPNTDVVKVKLKGEAKSYFDREYFNIIYTHMVNGKWTGKNTKKNVI